MKTVIKKNGIFQSKWIADLSREKTADVWPAFPRGYQGGIPCCASFLPDKAGEGDFEVIVREMK
jgi:hypothetical protein